MRGDGGSRRLAVGLVGVGLVAQAEHAYYLWEERDRFAFRAIADPSARARDAVGARYGVAELHAEVGPLLELGLDAVVIAAPDAVHAEVALAALDAGVHVLCEKPLALRLADCTAVADRAEQRGLIVQVGTMKRFDPAYERLLELLPDDPADVRMISIEVSDPDFRPFVSHLPMAAGGDVPAELVADTRARTWAAVEEEAGRPVDEADVTAHDGFLGCLVHDISLVHDVAGRYGAPPPCELLDAAAWDEGRGVTMSVRLPGGGRGHLTHLKLAGVADYRERMTVYCTDRVLELGFPSPYLRHHPTRLTVRRTDGDVGLTANDIHVSYEEAFRSELRGFHAAIVEGAPVRCDARDGAADIDLLARAFRLAAEDR